MRAMEQQVEFARVAVAGGRPVEFCVDPVAGDPVVPWLLEHGWIDEPVMRAFQSLLRPGARVLDLGSHLGLFSLPAAAAGAEVTAVDANAEHVRLLRLAAERNGFDRLQVVQAAVTDAGGPVEFVERSIHGHIHASGDDDAATVTVPSIAVDELLAQRGWDSLDLIKMDIEGAEPGALRSMAKLHAAGGRPAMVFECNAPNLPLFGESICRLRETIAALGYELLMIDHLRPGVLLETDSVLAIQPEAVCDYLALTERPDRLADGWVVEPALTLEQTVTRILDSASSEGEGYRRYAAALLSGGPQWLRSHPLALAARAALELDPSPSVRSALASEVPPRGIADHAEAPEPVAAGRPEDIVVLASGLSLRARTTEPERPGAPRPEELALSDLAFHLRAGQLLAVIADDRGASTALLRAIAGFEAPVAGSLELGPRATFVPDAEAGFEAGLSVAENVAVFAAFLGCHVPDVSGRVADIAARAGIADDLNKPLWEASEEAGVRIALAVALGCAEPKLLLLDRLPMVADPAFRGWAAARIDELRADGAAVIQVVGEPGELLARADRALALGGGQATACGNCDAVFAAEERRG
jgi:FkbM family methyltransferase